MNVTSQVSIIRNKIKDLTTPYKLETAEIREQIIAAVKDYSKRRPMKKRYTFSVVAGTDAYALPDGFIHPIYVPTASTWLSNDGTVRNTPSGLIPMAATFEVPEEYQIEGTQIRFNPEPASNYDLEMTYAAAHLASGTGSEEAYVTISPIDDDLVELKAAIGCLETLLSQMARENFKYTTGTTTIDKSGQAKDMKIILDRWAAHYDNQMLRPGGCRS